MKRILAIVLTLTMLLSLAACKKNTAPEGEVSGTVSAVDGNKITITTADGSECTFSVNDSTTYSMARPFGDGQEGGKRPEMPEGEMPNGERPEMPNGEMPEMPNGERPEMPEGEMPEMPEGGRPQMPEGEMPEMPNGERPEMPVGGFQMEAGLDMIRVGTTLTATIASDGTAANVAIRMNFGGFGGGKPGGDSDAANT